MTSAFRQALCCECGSVRDFRRARNYQQENYGFRGPVNRDWHRETGDLKCRECGRITRHALLHPEKDVVLRDHAERLTRIALGSTTDPIARDEKDRARIQAAYRTGRTPNPYLGHSWSTALAAEARKAGLDYTTAWCGERVQLPESGGEKKIDTSKPVKPQEVRANQEYQDLDTGMYWLDMDCVDCYRYINEQRLVRRRKLLTEWLIWLLASPGDRVPDEHVEHLIGAFEVLR